MSSGMRDAYGGRMFGAQKGHRPPPPPAMHCHDCGITYDDGRAACPRCEMPTTTKGPDGEEPE